MSGQEQPASKRVTANDLLLAGWHRISEPIAGTYWWWPQAWGQKWTFAKAVKAYKEGLRDE